MLAAGAIAAGAVAAGTVVAGAVAAGAVAAPPAPTAPAALASGFGPQQLTALRARFVGPLGVGGRITAIAAVESQPEVIFAGTAAGGVWKSADAGASWRPVFDDQPVAAIGALAVFQARPEIVWAGTGEANLHATVTGGDGVYRSTDGGGTWTRVGLAGSGHIARIVLHPSNPDVAWVAAVGPVWREGGERGVYKTEDGGKSWALALAGNAATGAGDLALDPGNPARLLANLWQVRRWPWELRSGGPGSGLYLSEDGGRSWTRRGPAEGFPEGEVGRMKLAFAPSRPQVAYAMVELARAGVLLRSEDGGRAWRQVYRHANLFPRPFFFGEMKVDPRRPDRLYSLHFDLDLSDDGGKSWDGRLGRGVHPDMHALWIDPRDPDHLLIGTDGGVYASHDGGHSAAPLGEVPVTQFNRVAVDLDTPYHVYGGAQDNGSWRGASASWEAEGISERGWRMVGDGDGSIVFADPAAPGQGYAIAQNGDLERWDLATGEWRDIRPRLPASTGSDAAPRFGWLTPLALDPRAPGTLYCGSQRVLRSLDRGASWTAISPDLTTNDPAWQRQEVSGGLTPDAGGAETYTTISAIAPSPLAAGLLWVGTDDGRIQLTRDGGASWQSVEDRVRGVPPHAWVARILASRFAAGSAFVLFDDHRRGDEHPYVVRTDDYGATWHRLATAGVRGEARAIEQDPADRDLLFLGTGAGLWLTRDGGDSWLQWPAGPAAAGKLPPAPVVDLVVHPRDQDLVIATFGRGIFIVDDISPLRHLVAAELQAPLRLFPIAAAQQHRVPSSGQRPGPHGEERPYGALLTFWARPEAVESGQAAGSAEIQISDRAGRPLRALVSPLRPGLNRVVWGLERDATARRPRAGGRGPLPASPGPGTELPPGTYLVRVRAGGHEDHGTVRIVADPRSKNTEADWQAWDASIRRTDQLRATLVQAVERTRRARADLELLRQRFPGNVPQPSGPAAEIAARAASLEALEARLIVPAGSPLGEARHDLSARLFDLQDALAGSTARLTPTQGAELRAVEADLASVLATINGLNERLVPLRDRLVPKSEAVLAPEPPLALPPPG
jgi:photosystem II stability/assembly factor-like uncharacterized protein